MEIKPKCDKYKKELSDFGGLFFSPPNLKSFVKKYHICKICFKKIEKKFNDK